MSTVPSRIPPDSNELNASYAADGYARVNDGKLGVVLTTYAVQPQLANFRS